MNSSIQLSSASLSRRMGQSVRVFPCLARVLPSVSPSGQFAQTIHQVFLVQLFLASDLLQRAVWLAWKSPASPSDPEVVLRSVDGRPVPRDWPTNLPRDPNSPSPPLPLQASLLPSTQEAHEAPGKLSPLDLPLSLPSAPSHQAPPETRIPFPRQPASVSQEPVSMDATTTVGRFRFPSPWSIHVPAARHVSTCDISAASIEAKTAHISTGTKKNSSSPFPGVPLQQCGPLDRLPGRPSLSTEQQPPGHRRPARDQHLGASRHAQPPISSSPRITSSARRRTRLLPSPKCVTSTAPHLVRSSRLGPFGQGRFLRPEHPWQSTLWFANKLLFASCKDVGMVNPSKTIRPVKKVRVARQSRNPLGLARPTPTSTSEPGFAQDAFNIPTVRSSPKEAQRRAPVSVSLGVTSPIDQMVQVLCVVSRAWLSANQAPQPLASPLKAPTPRSKSLQRSAGPPDREV